MKNLAVFAFVSALAVSAGAGTITVGPEGCDCKRPSAAARMAKDGDTVVIAAGEYKGDVCAWRANNLTIRGAGIDKTVLDADGRICMGKGLWVICGTNTTVEGVTFRKATCKDHNAAGIRHDVNGDLTVRACSFVDNENGILTGPFDKSTVLVEDSRFFHNGAGDGYSHNLYIGGVAKLIFRNNVSDHANRGHDLKSRAHETYIENCVFDDGEDGMASYLVNCPNGGKVTMRNCKLVQSRTASNGVMVAIGEEGAYDETEFWSENNTFVNKREDGGHEVVLRCRPRK